MSTLTSLSLFHLQVQSVPTFPLGNRPRTNPRHAGRATQKVVLAFALEDMRM